MNDDILKALVDEVAAANGYGGLDMGTMYGKFAFDVARRAVLAERERAGLVCDDEARIRCDASDKHPENSPARDRCLAAARAAMNCAVGIRGGEVVRSNAAADPR